MPHMALLFQISEPMPTVWLGLVGAVALLFVFFVAFLVKQYKGCV